MNNKLQALLDAGTVTLANSGTCAECETYPEVLDGHRKAAPAKYAYQGDGYCGKHIVRTVEGRETEWNGTSYKAPSKTGTKRVSGYRKPRREIWLEMACQGSKVYWCETHASRREPGKDCRTKERGQRLNKG
jgi:hypothetical protein